MRKQIFAVLFFLVIIKANTVISENQPNYIPVDIEEKGQTINSYEQNTQAESEPEGEPHIPLRRTKTDPEVELVSQPEDEPEILSKVEPNTQPEGEPDSEPAPPPEGEPEDEPNTGTNAEPASQPEGRPEIVPESETNTNPEGEPGVEAASQPEGEPEGEPNTGTNAEPASQPEGRPEIFPESETNAHPEGESGVEAASPPEGEPEDEPNTGTNAEPASQPEGRQEILPESETNTNPEGEPGVEAASQPEGEPEGEPNTGTNAEPASQPEGRPEILPESETNAHPGEPGVEAASQPEGEPETLLPESEPNTYPEGEPEGESITEVEPESLPAGEPNTHPERESENETISQPESESETLPETQPTVTPEVEPESQPEVEPEVNASPVSSTNCKFNSPCLSRLMQSYVSILNVQKHTLNVKTILFNEICRSKDAFISCIDTSCGSQSLIMLITKLFEFPCREGKTDFIRHMDCISGDRFNQAIQKCVKKYPILFEGTSNTSTCDNITDYVGCITEASTMACGSAVSRLVTSYFKTIEEPFRLYLKCPVQTTEATQTIEVVYATTSKTQTTTAKNCDRYFFNTVIPVNNIDQWDEWCNSICQRDPGHCPVSHCRYGCELLHCRGVGIHRYRPGMDQWCSVNCATNYCPSNYCTCSTFNK